MCLITEINACTPHIFSELDADNNLVANYTHNPTRDDDILSANFTQYAVALNQGGSALSDGQILSDRTGSVYYVKDHLNTVSNILDSSGQIIQSFAYSSFGKILNVTNSSGQELSLENAPIRTTYTFTGREFESESKTYNYRARQYDPSIGRFMQIDPEPGKIKSPRSFLSKYAYVQNTPTLFNDPTGRVPNGGTATPKNYFPNPSYAHGEWCGSAAAGPREPIDNLDRACKLHDDAYGFTKGVNDAISTQHNFLNPDYSKFEARMRTNLNLVSEGLKLAFSSDRDFFDGVGVAAWGLYLAYIEVIYNLWIGNILRLVGI